MGTRYPGTGAVSAATQLIIPVNEVPTGAIDGSNATFTLSSTPANSARVALFHNGVKLVYLTHYTISGVTITFSTSPDYRPQTGDSLQALYGALI